MKGTESAPVPKWSGTLIPIKATDEVKTSTTALAVPRQ